MLIKKITLSFIGLIMVVAFANLLPQETYGTYKFVLSITAILAISTLSGMNPSLIRSVAKGYEGSLIPVFYARLKWGAIGSVGGLGLALYYYVQGHTTLTIVFILFALFLPFKNAFSIYKAYWQGKKQFDTFAKFIVLHELLVMIPILLTLLFTDNIVTIFVVYLLSWVIPAAGFFFFTIRRVKNTQRDSETITYGKFLSLIGILSTIANHSANILIWHFAGAIPVALYNFAVRPPQEIKRIFTETFPISFPKFSERSKKEIKQTLLKKVAKLYIVLIPATIIYILLAPMIYNIFFPKYTEVIFYSQLFAVTILLIPSSLFGILYQAQASKKEMLISGTLMPIIVISSLLIFVPKYGILGAIIASVITHVLGLALQIFLFRRMKV